MKIDLSDKTALVTGSTAGIGHAIARGLAATGATVVVNGRTQAKVDAAVAAVAKAVPEAKLRGVAADVSTAAGCKATPKTRVNTLTWSSAPGARSAGSQLPLFPLVTSLSSDGWS